MEIALLVMSSAGKSTAMIIAAIGGMNWNHHFA
jgi:hypothetical protein